MHLFTIWCQYCSFLFWNLLFQVPYLQIRENNWTFNADVNGRWNVRFDLWETELQYFEGERCTFRTHVTLYSVGQPTSRRWVLINETAFFKNPIIYLFMFILSKIQPPKAATVYSGLEFAVHLGRGLLVTHILGWIAFVKVNCVIRKWPCRGILSYGEWCSWLNLKDIQVQ